MTTNLQQIAKQVSLINRLIELLRMQEEITEINLEYFGWVIPTEEPRRSYDRYVWELSRTNQIEVATLEEAWQHPTTQKAWSDELVKVAREYLKIPDLVYEICKGISNETLSSRLEAILNKYGRSLIE